MSKLQVDPRQSTSPPTLEAHSKAHTGGTRSSSPRSLSHSTSPSSGTTSLGSPSTAPTTTGSSATGSSTTIPTNDEVEAVIKMATSTRPTPDGRPPPGKDTRTQLYAGNLPYRVRWQDLKDLFRRAGTVLRADVSLSPDNRSRGYGTVLMASAEDAGRAVDMFHGFSWQGRILEVRLDRLGAVPGADLDPALASSGAAAVAAAAFPNIGMGFREASGLGRGLTSRLGMGMGLGVGGLSAGSLQVPSPHPALPLAAHNLNMGGSLSMPTTAGNVNSGIPSLSAGSAAMTAGVVSGVPSSAFSAASSLNSIPSSPIHASLLAVQQQQQQIQRDREREDLLLAQAQTQAQLRVHSALKSNLLGANLGVSPGIGPSPLSTGSTTSDTFLSLGALGRQDGYERDSRPASHLGMRSLFVGNLPFHCQWQDLKDLFRQAGTIVRADVSLGPDGRSRGFGTVAFANEIDAERAVTMFNGYDYNGRTLKVHYDRFCAQSPLPPQNFPNFQHSLNSTPVQPAAASTQAALLQAAQLRQLVSGQSHGDLHSASHPAVQAFNQASTSATSALAALHEFNSTGHIGLGGSSDHREKGVGNSPVSPFSHHFALGSGGLAERRQHKTSFSSNLPAPIGSGSTSAASSRPGTSAGSALASTSASASTLSAAALSAGVERLGSIGRATTLALDEVIPPIPLSRPAHSMPAVPKASDAKSSFDAESASSSSRSQAQPSVSSTSPRTTHPAHPGPISLPPPAPIGPFPLYSPHHAHLQQSMSPTFGHPMSPYGYPAYPLNLGPMSPPVFLPGYMQMHAGHTMTPHGLPPITPSMPSFSFVPQPSPGLGGQPNQAGFGSSAIPPTPKEGDGPSGASDGGSSPDSGNTQSASYPIDHAQQQQSGGQGLPPYAMYGMMSPPMHIPGHVFQPFTPGSTMSPGVYFQPAPGGRGGAFVSSAIGSPVMGHPPQAAYFGHPGSQPGSPYYGPPTWTTAVPPAAAAVGPSTQQPGQQEGYFPSLPPQKQEGYFPPVPPTLSTSGLANEILRDGSNVLDGSNDEGGDTHSTTAGGEGGGIGVASLMSDISSLSLGPALSTSEAVPIPVASSKQSTSVSSSPSYAAIASTRPNRSESSSSSGGSGVLGVTSANVPGARHNSMSASRSGGRPNLAQKTLSDEGKVTTGKTSGLLFSS